MKKFRLTPQNLNLLLAIGGVLIFVAVYFLVFQNFSAKNDELDSQISSRGQYLSELEVYNENVQEYEDGIVEYKSKINGLLARLPNDLKPEDFLLYLKELHDGMEIQLHQVGFGADDMTSEFSTTINDKTENVVGYRTEASISTEMTYDQLKQYLNKIYDPSKPVTFVNTLTCTYDSANAYLNVSTTLSKYYLKYDNAVYTPYPLNGVRLGTDNPFKTTSAPSNP